MSDPNQPERHINIHFSPDIMAGVYSNFANVSHSDYEFTITFARVDHEVEDEEIPGVVVSRVNLRRTWTGRTSRVEALLSASRFQTRSLLDRRYMMRWRSSGESWCPGAR